MGGAANTSPGQAASSIPLPTIITCAGSCPEPEPWTIETLSSLGASVRMIRLYSGTYFNVSGFARAIPLSISGTNSFGSFTNFFMLRSPSLLGGRPRVSDLLEHDRDGDRPRVQRPDAALTRIRGASPLGEHLPRGL